MKHIDYSSILDTSLTYLLSLQQNDGSFLTLSSSSKKFTTPLTYQTTFATSTILLSLSDLPPSPKLTKIKQRAVQFLLAQKSDNWSWNYWTRHSTEANEMAYPDDLDDTFCALAALFQHDAKIIDGKAMANIVQLLTATEIKEGGPYRTWIVDKHAAKPWQNSDIAVNSNIAYFLFLQDIVLPNLTKFIDTQSKKGNFSSAYYPTSYPVIYFLSRYYQGIHTETIRKYLLDSRRKNHSWGNALFTAMAISSLLNLQMPAHSLSKSIAYLIQEKRKGEFQPYPFCFDPSQNQKKYYSGSSALTTAFYLEALFSYEKKQRENDKSIQIDNYKEKLYQEILLEVNKRLSIMDKPIRKELLKQVRQLLKKDTGRNIPLLPYYFFEALGVKRKNSSDDLLIKLGVANILGWIAYTIYDNFLDEEGTPSLLPIANGALREVTSLFEHLLPQTEFSSFFHKVMNQLDYANFWEVTYCRFSLNEKPVIPHFKNLDQLAQKSFGHALGPLAILFSLGYKENTYEVTSLATFFKHYLIIKQLNDDAHDWEKDLQRGQISAVGALVLDKFQPTSTQKNIPSISTIIPQLQQIFWHETIEELTIISQKHKIKAQRALKKCTFITNPQFLEQLLEKQIDPIQNALTEQKKAVQFLENYTQ